jgi:hypothetical protein
MAEGRFQVQVANQERFKAFAKRFVSACFSTEDPKVLSVMWMEMPGTAMGSFGYVHEADGKIYSFDFSVEGDVPHLKTVSTLGDGGTKTPVADAELARFRAAVATALSQG